MHPHYRALRPLAAVMWGFVAGCPRQGSVDPMASGEAPVLGISVVDSSTREPSCLAVAPLRPGQHVYLTPAIRSVPVVEVWCDEGASPGHWTVSVTTRRPGSVDSATVIQLGVGETEGVPIVNMDGYTGDAFVWIRIQHGAAADLVLPCTVVPDTFPEWR